jgi:hypothetical protein
VAVLLLCFLAAHSAGISCLDRPQAPARPLPVFLAAPSAAVNDLGPQGTTREAPGWLPARLSSCQPSAYAGVRPLAAFLPAATAASPPATWTRARAHIEIQSPSAAASNLPWQPPKPHMIASLGAFMSAPAAASPLPAAAARMLIEWVPAPPLRDGTPCSTPPSACLHHRGHPHTPPSTFAAQGLSCQVMHSGVLGASRIRKCRQLTPTGSRLVPTSVLSRWPLLLAASVACSGTSPTHSCNGSMSWNVAPVQYKGAAGRGGMHGL